MWPPVDTTLTALVQDKVWMTEVNFLPFIPPTDPSPPNEVGSEAVRSSKVDPVWVESAEMLDKDLHWLLQLEYHKFWSQVCEVALSYRSLDLCPIDHQDHISCPIGHV